MPYDVGYRRIMIAVPIDIWEVIRLLGSARLDLVDASDEDLLELVKREVDNRVTAYQRIISSNLQHAEAARFHNSLIFGAADEGREQQIARGVDYYRTERERQRGVINRMAQHKIINIDGEPDGDQKTDT